MSTREPIDDGTGQPPEVLLGEDFIEVQESPTNYTYQYTPKPQIFLPYTAVLYTSFEAVQDWLAYLGLSGDPRIGLAEDGESLHVDVEDTHDPNHEITVTATKGQMIGFSTRGHFSVWYRPEFEKWLQPVP
jgi:hypothetical protein